MILLFIPIFSDTAYHFLKNGRRRDKRTGIEKKIVKEKYPKYNIVCCKENGESLGIDNMYD